MGIIISIVLSFLFILGSSFAAEIKFGIETSKEDIIQWVDNASKVSFGYKYTPVKVDNPTAAIISLRAKQTDFTLLDSGSIASLPRRRLRELRSVSAIPQYLHIATLTEKGIVNLFHLRRRVVSLGPKGGESETAAKDLFKAMGVRITKDITCKHFDLKKQPEQLDKGKDEEGIDAFIELAGLPSTNISDVGEDLCLIPIPANIVTKMAQISGTPYRSGHIKLENYLPEKKEEIPTAIAYIYVLSPLSIDERKVDNMVYTFTLIGLRQMNYDDALISTVYPLRDISNLMPIHPYVRKTFIDRPIPFR
ncbi:MAG: TAXI family TRAP transporter solute-binding subunit [Candidatus Hodarchaeota archaeon]